MSAFSPRQVALILTLYKQDGRIDDFHVSAPAGTPKYLVYSKHLPGGQETFTRARLVKFLRSIGELT